VLIIKRRSRDIDNKVWILRDQLIQWTDDIKRIFISYVPDILTYGKSDLFALIRYDFKRGSGLEVSVFIEYIIGGK